MIRIFNTLSVFAGLFIVFVTGQLVSADPGVSSRPSTQPGASLPLDLSDLLEIAPEASLNIKKQADMLGSAYLAATTGEEKAAALLAKANWTLAVPLAGIPTSWLLGLQDLTNEDRDAIGTNADSALKEMADARSILQDDREISRGKRRELLDAAEILELFAEFFKVVGAPGADSDEYRSACAKAALSLSAAREADNSAVASCALLWQSFAWDLAGKRDRALVSLPDALRKPEQWPYDFICRLLRCRIIADAGQYTAATALTIQIRSSCRQWLENMADDPDSCGRLAGLLQYRIGMKWMKQLNSTDSRRLKAVLDRLQKDLFDDVRCKDIYYLEYAVPIIVSVPEPASPSTSTAPQ